MKFQVKPMLDGTTAIGVVKDDFVIGILMIGDAGLIPSPAGCCPVFITLILVEYRRHLVLVDGEYQFLHFQTAMDVYCVEIGDLPVLVIERSMEIVSVTNADAWVDKHGIIGWINGQVKSDNTVAAMDAMVSVGLLAGMIIGYTIKCKTLTVTDKLGYGSFVVRWPVIQM